jgi:hypothetical protein
MAYKEVWNDPKPGTNFRTRSFVKENSDGGNTTVTSTKYNNNAPDFVKGIMQSKGSGGSKRPVSLKYPLEDTDFYKAAIKFSVHSVDPYEVDLISAKDLIDMPLIMAGYDKGKKMIASLTEDPADRDEATVDLAPDATASYSTDVANEATVDTASALKAKQREEAFNASIAKGGRSLGILTKDLDRKVTLYFPPGLIIQDGAQYDNADLGFMGTTALGGIRRGNSLISSMAKGVKDGLMDTFQLMLGNFAPGEAAQLAAARAVEKIPFSGVQNAAKIALQRVISPNTRTMFRGVPIKTYAFTFKFVATSKDEADQINDIIKFFRTEVYPESMAPGGIPLGYKFPNIFRLQFMWNGGVNEAIPQPLLSYLLDVSTTYNPSSMSFHEDGNPTEIDLTLRFQEYRAMSRQDVEQPLDGGK